METGLLVELLTIAILSFSSRNILWGKYWIENLFPYQTKKKNEKDESMDDLIKRASDQTKLSVDVVKVEDENAF